MNETKLKHVLDAADSTFHASGEAPLDVGAWAIMAAALALQADAAERQAKTLERIARSLEQLTRYAATR